MSSTAGVLVLVAGETVVPAAHACLAISQRAAPMAISPIVQPNPMDTYVRKVAGAMPLPPLLVLPEAASAGGGCKPLPCPAGSSWL